MDKISDVDAIQREFLGIKLGDKRLDTRAVDLLGRIAVAPSDSFPEQMGSDTELEGLYRFFSNPKVTMDALLRPHIHATHERIQRHRVVRVAHDTSAFRFSGDREGLGVILGETKGFFGHLSLAISADERREPLGVLALRPFIRTEAEVASRRNMTNSERVTASRNKPREQRESSRWETQAIDVTKDFPKTVRAIHLMDQEGDDYYALATMQKNGLSFVVRADPKRKTAENLATHEVLSKEPAHLFRTVQLTERKDYKNRKKGHPIRPEREANLEVRWGTVTFRCAQYIDIDIKHISLNSVHVFEPAPPKGEEPIEWMLLTSEPVTSLDEATAIVDHYRARWMIEEYFKALKTGCAIEKRQLTSFEGLTNALAIFVPVAWHLLRLRHLARTEPSLPATRIFDAEQLLLLCALLVERGHKLPEHPPIRDVMLGVARLGGHIRNNGEPGWIVLGRGYVRFAEAEIVWRLARRCDQS